MLVLYYHFKLTIRYYLTSTKPEIRYTRLSHIFLCETSQALEPSQIPERVQAIVQQLSWWSAGPTKPGTYSLRQHPTARFPCLPTPSSGSLYTLLPELERWQSSSRVKVERKGSDMSLPTIDSRVCVCSGVGQACRYGYS